MNRIGEANENEENNVTQDLLHSIEIEPHTYNEYACLLYTSDAADEL